VRRDLGLALVVLLLLAGGAAHAAPRAPVVNSKRMSLDELRELARAVGFPDVDTAAAVAMAESKGDPFATNIVDQPTAGHLRERSFGLWQVNTLAHPEFDETQLLGAQYNAHAALMLSQSGTDWHQWSTFTDGTYRQYMPGA